MKQRKNYSALFEVRDGYICVSDQSAGTNYLSVTNAAEDVATDAVNEFGNLPILYKDTTGSVDQLIHDNGYFQRFEFIGAETFEQAIESI